MIGMNFSAFLTLLILGFVSSVVLHFLIRYRMLNGLDGFLSKWIAGWGGGWLGSAVFGHWGMHSAGLYLIPALLGAFVAPFAITALCKVSAMTSFPRQSVMASQPGIAPQFEMRKAS